MTRKQFGFDHTAFQVSNMSEAITWYTEVLGFSLLFKGINQEEQEAYSFLSYGGSRLELIEDLQNPYEKPPIKKPFCPHLCLEIENMEKALELLTEKKSQDR